jgi:hypothetical protein
MSGLSKHEKEKLIVDLYYNENKTYKEITKEAKVSLRDIQPILKKYDSSNQTVSISSQAYQLFLKGKTPVEAAIALNIREPEATQLYKEFWKLNQLYEFNQIYEEFNGDMKYFLDLCKAAKSAKMGVPQVIKLLRVADGDLQSVETRYEDLSEQIRNLETRRESSQAQLESINDTLRTAHLTLRSTIKDSDNEMGKLLDLKEQTAKQRKKLAMEAADEIDTEVLSEPSMISLSPLLPLVEDNEEERTSSLQVRTSNR